MNWEDLIAGRWKYKDPGLEIDGLTGNQLPPPYTGYFREFQQCGIPNHCPTNSNNQGPTKPGCLPPPASSGRKKRGILRPPGLNHSTTTGEDYVINGDDVGDYYYPWMILLAVNKDQSPLGNWEIRCTATLISSKHALTACHCVYDTRAHTGINLKDGSGYGRTFALTQNLVQVYFGPAAILPTTDVKNIPPSRIVRKIHVPPKPAAGDRDMALLEFDDVEFSEYVRPICLPINGFPSPSSLNFIYAGYGEISISTREDPEYLQELAPLVITDDDVLRARTFRGNDGFEYVAASSSRKAVFFKYASMDSSKSTNYGDSGGPIMWLNSDTDRYTIVGVHTHGKDSGGHMSGMKVHMILNWLMDQLKPRSWNVCVHPDCRTEPTKAIKRTWTLHVKSSTKEYKTLATPCQEVPEMDSPSKNKFICPVALAAERYKFLDREDLTGSVTKQKENRWRFCTLNCTTNSLGRDWDPIFYLDEITSGSFVQPKYTGLEAPGPDNQQFNFNLYIKDTERHKQAAHTNMCEVNNNNGHTHCPFFTHSDEPCILSENICDGHNDCADGWDESPHLCIGKCDFWRQYQYPEIAYPEDSGTTGHKIQYSIHEASASAKSCHEHCAKKGSACTHFNWFGNQENKWGEKVCETFEGYNKSDKDALVVAVQDKSKYVVRGPRECPGMFKKKKGNLKCKPVYGVPYQTGIYLLQAYNGQYLVNGGVNGIPKLRSVKYTTITKKGDTTLGGQWQLRLITNGSSLYKTMFTIKSAKDETYLTFDKNSKFLTTENEMANPTQEKTQLWKIERGYRIRGYIGTPIYAELGGKRYYMTVPLAHSNLFTAYHIKEVGQPDHTNDERKTELQAVKKEALKPSIVQRFLFLECHVPKKFDGILRRRPSYESDTLEGIIEIIFGSTKPSEFRFPHLMDYKQGEILFLTVFGLNPARYYQMFENMKKKQARVHLQIIEAMKESSTIFDYAGKMRTSPYQFHVMYLNWRNLANATDEALHGCNWLDCRVHMDHLKKYVKQKVDTGFHNTFFRDKSSEDNKE